MIHGKNIAHIPCETQGPEAASSFFTCGWLKDFPFRLPMLPRISARYEAPLLTVVIVEEGQGFLYCQQFYWRTDPWRLHNNVMRCKPYMHKTGISIWRARYLWKPCSWLEMLTLEIMLPHSESERFGRLDSTSKIYVPDSPSRSKGLFNDSYPMSSFVRVASSSLFMKNNTHTVEGRNPAPHGMYKTL